MMDIDPGQAMYEKILAQRKRRAERIKEYEQEKAIIEPQQEPDEKAATEDAEGSPGAAD